MTINDREASQPRLNNTVARRFRRRAEETVVGGPPRLPHRREAWCYKRLSSQEQRKNSLWSLAEQDNLEELARREGYAAPLDAEAVAALKAAPDFPGHYVNGQVHVEERDIGLSGTKNHRFRPGLAALIEAIAAGRVEAVYVVHISRLYRDQTLIDAMTFADLCKRHKVVIVTPQLAFDLNQDLYFDLYKMEVENAVRELKLMKLRLHGSRLLKARHGYYDGRGVAWGYILDLDRGSPTYQKLVPYEPHAAIVREIFRLALVYRAARAVRQHLLDRELFFPPFPPEVAEMLAGRHCRKTCRLRPDGSWLPRNQAVLSILTNPVYIGWWLVRGEVVSRANHPPLVDEQTFWAVQEIWNPIDYRSGDVNPSYSANAGRAVGRRRRHALHYLALAEAAAPGGGAIGPVGGRAAWLARLAAELDNLRAALAWAEAAGDGEVGPRLAGALAWAWYSLGLPTEGRAWLGRMRALAGTATPAARRAKAAALLGLSLILALQQDFPAARAAAEEHLALWQGSDDLAGRAGALLGLGGVAVCQGDGPVARAAFGESLDLFRRLEHEAGMAVVCYHLALVALGEGRLTEAGAQLAACRAVAVGRGDGWIVGYVAVVEGLVALEDGDAGRARALLTEGLVNQPDLDRGGGLPAAVDGFAALAAAEGRPARAVRLAAAAAAHWRRLGLAHSAFWRRAVARWLARAEAALGEAEAAAARAAGAALTLEEAAAEALAE